MRICPEGAAAHGVPLQEQAVGRNCDAWREAHAGAVSLYSIKRTYTEAGEKWEKEGAAESSSCKV